MLKKIVIYIINFFFIISTFLLVSLLILSNTILSKQYVMKSLEKNNYYETIYYDIEEGFEDYIMQSGLEKDVLENLYDKQKVHNDINMVLDTIYENKELNIDTKIVKEKLHERINNVLKENNRVPGREEKEAIETFENTIIDVYNSKVVYSQKYVEQLADAYAKVQPILTKIKIALGVVSLFLLVIIIAINKSRKESVKTIGIAMLTVGILHSSLKLVIGKRVHNILILSKTFSEGVIYLVDAIVNTFFIVGIIMIVIGVATIILNNMKKTANHFK